MKMYYVKRTENGYSLLDPSKYGKPYDWQNMDEARKESDVVVFAYSKEMLERILDQTVDVVKVTCYNRTELMERNEAIEFYKDCMFNSEGSEQDRYTNIYMMLSEGLKEANDGVF